MSCKCNFIPFFGAVVFFCVVACSNSASESPENIVDVPDTPADTVPPVVPNVNVDSAIASLDLVEIRSSGKSVYLGTDVASAKADERPRMKVEFDYDFAIGRREVTCGEFNVVMKGASKLEIACENDSLPVADVSLFDAVLFVNAQSKALKMDTAYTYTRALFGTDGHCTSLEGLSFKSQSDGLRLPTEAEWMYAAQENWTPEKSWNAGNSKNKAHKVCSANQSTKICDMAGNVMEWVSDWQGSFRDTTMKNFVGATDGGDLGLRVVHGGCFRTDPSSMFVYSRGDIYAVTSSTHADYVGFRLARGAIQKPTWLSRNGAAVVSNIVALANAVTVRGVTEAYKVKLVFRNDVSGNLAYIDYNSGSLAPVEIKDDIDAYHPDISPDGSKVAFCTGLEGVNTVSELYVRDLNPAGTGLVKLDVESAAIPRWRVLENGDTVIVYVTSAANNKDDASFFAQSTWQVPFSNGKFGTPEKLFDGSFHGGVSADNRMAVTGSTRFLTRLEGADGNAQTVVWYNGEQACNVSLSKDGSKRSLLLDFAPEFARNAVNIEYGVHEIVFVVDSNGMLIQGLIAPDSSSFDHTEWVYDVTPRTSGGHAVATVANKDGAHTKITLLDFRDSRLIDLVEGEELWHPAMWANTAANQAFGSLDMDSAGVYALPNCGEPPMLLRYKLELLWTYKDSANVVILGSSRPMEGVIPALMSKEFFAINMANVPNMLYVSEHLFKNYVVPHVKNLKYLVISLDIDLWHHADNSDYNFYYKTYKDYPGFVYDENHDFWKDGYPEGLAEMTQSAYGSDAYARYFRDEMGFVRLDPGSWFSDNPLVAYDSTWMSYESQNFESAFGHLENILELAAENDVKVLGVVFPQSPGYKKTGSFGIYGIRRSEAPALLQRIADLSKKYPNFHFMDENKMGNHDYTDDMAINYDHLAYTGAPQMTARIDSALKTMK